MWSQTRALNVPAPGNRNERQLAVSLLHCEPLRPIVFDFFLPETSVESQINHRLSHLRHRVTARMAGVPPGVRGVVGHRAPHTPLGFDVEGVGTGRWGDA